MRVTAIDVETTGLDLFHGCRPYLVTICEDGNTPVYYEWPVDPLTREVQPDDDDLNEICDYIARADRIVGHNIRFDIKALHTVIPDIEWPWDKTFDTVLAAHIIASSMPFNLTDLCLYHLTDGKGHGLNILPLEEDLGKAVKKVRGQIKRHLPEWQLTAEGHEHMPSAKSGGKSAEEKMWKGDCWILKALFDYAEAQPEWSPPIVETVGRRKRKAPEPPWYYEFRDINHPYRGLLPNYANADSYVTHALAMVLWKKLQQNDLWDIYLGRLKILRPTFRMESYGFTSDIHSLTDMQARFHSDVDDDSELLTAIAAQHDYELKLSKAGSNKNTNDFVFNVLGLEPVKDSKKTGNPSLDKDARTIYELTLPKRSEALEFIKAFGRRQSKLTGIAYMNGYHKHGIPINKNWIRLHPTFNPTGTNTLRWSCKNPNLANIAKKTSRCDECDGTGHITSGKKQVKCHECNGSGEQSLSLRYCFGPAPGREWWSMDYENIELRIPAYEAGEESMIELFEHPDDPPYYGSYHLLNAGIIYPDEFWAICEQKGAFKEKYKSTLYQWVKNFGFACVPMDTEALTKEGWKKYDEINETDEVLGWKDGNMVWSKVHGKVLYEDAELWTISNNHFSATVTPDHRWFGNKLVRPFGGKTQYVNCFFKTCDIKQHKTITLSAPVRSDKVLDITDDEAAIIGFVYSDGSVRKSKKSWGPSRGCKGGKVGFSVFIYQTKKEGIEYIDSLLTRWDGGFKRYYGKEGKNDTWLLNPEKCRSIWKRAGLWDTQDFEGFVRKLDESQRKAFLEAVYIAEGNIDSRGNTKLYTQNKGAFSDAIKLAIFMSGKFVTTSDKNDYYGSGNLCQTIRESKPYVTGQRMKKDILPGRHRVWCLQTETGTWVMRQNGQIMLTGNCQYECQEATGDKAARKKGSFKLVKTSLPKLTELKAHYVREATRTGYVQTIPDKTINPRRGYPIMCSRMQSGYISPTVPFSYHVQSTAMQCTTKAMIRIDDYLIQNKPGFFINNQVHDELVFDFPKGKGDKPWETNLPTARHIQKLMEQSGDDIGIPLRVSVEYHEKNWAEGRKM